MVLYMARDNNYFRYRRQKLLREHPYCCWCNRLVYEKPAHVKKFLPHYATIEHLTSKYNKRVDPEFKKKTLALACWECNNKRGSEETKSKSKFYLWWRSGSFPRHLKWLQVIRNLIKGAI